MWRSPVFLCLCTLHLTLTGLVVSEVPSPSDTDHLDWHEQSTSEYDQQFDHFGHHDPNFDHDHVVGSQHDVKQFAQLPPEIAKSRLANMFVKIDTNKDGDVDREELKQWIIQIFKSLDLEITATRLNEQDENKDKVVSWSEYLDKVYGYTEKEIDQLRNDKASESKSFVQSLEEEKMKFHLADQDSSGGLNETEYAAFIHPHNYRHMAPYEMIHTLRSYDHNSDGLISEEEFLSDVKLDKEALVVQKESFKRYDKNKDGKLDQDELTEWITPGFDITAKIEVDHLFSETDKNKDEKLTKDEILAEVELWVGSQATDYGRHLEHGEVPSRDEL